MFLSTDSIEHVHIIQWECYFKPVTHDQAQKLPNPDRALFRIVKKGIQVWFIWMTKVSLV